MIFDKEPANMLTLMKILHVYKTFLNDTFGGVERVIAELAASSDATTFEHTVVSLSSDVSKASKRQGSVFNLRFKETFNWASNAVSIDLFLKFNRIVQDYDIIHYHFPWPFADCMHLFWNIRRPTILTYHADIVRQKNLLRLYRPVMTRFLKKMDCIVATSPQYVETSAILKPYHDKTTVVPIGLNDHHYPPATDEALAYWRARCGEKFFLFVGVLRYYKGLHILLSALVGTPFVVVLAGQGPEFHALQAQAKALGVAHQVHFLNEVTDDEKIALLTLCEAFVFPSHLRSEAFGVSLLEAALLGKPMISTEIGTGTSYINIDQKTGWVVPPNDPDALRHAMRVVWEEPNLAIQRGHKARQRYETLFTGAAMAAQYEALYRHIKPLKGEK